MRHWENGVSQSFLSDQCDSCISPENEGFDVRWVRFPKHIPLFPTLSQLESVGLEGFPDWVQRVVRELVVETTVKGVFISSLSSFSRPRQDAVRLSFPITPRNPRS